MKLIWYVNGYYEIQERPIKNIKDEYGKDRVFLPAIKSGDVTILDEQSYYCPYSGSYKMLDGLFFDTQADAENKLNELRLKKVAQLKGEIQRAQAEVKRLESQAPKVKTYRELIEGGIEKLKSKLLGEMENFTK
jgi:hypothetical protein